MLFQLGGQSTQVLAILQDWGVFSALLPFLLIFTLLFAILEKIQLFEGNRKINAVIAGAIGALVVIPHVLGQYPTGMDPVLMILNILPNAGVLLVVILLVMMMLGFVGAKHGLPGALITLVLLGALAILGFTVISAIWPSLPFSRLFGDTATQALIIAITVFGFIIYFITKEDKPKDPNAPKNIFEWIEENVGKKI